MNTYFQKLISMGLGIFLFLMLNCGGDETSQSSETNEISAPKKVFKDIPAPENPFIEIPATENYPDIKASNTMMTYGDDFDETLPVAVNRFQIQQYEVTNFAFASQFMDLDSDGDVLEKDLTGCSAYYEPNCEGKSGLTAQEAWEAVVDSNGDGEPNREVSLNREGVTFGLPSPLMDNELDVGFTLKSPQWWDITLKKPWRNEDYAKYSAYSASPVVFISWYEARAYCKFVFGKEFDLPTLAQWTRVSKGQNPSGPFPWGDSTDLKGKANCQNCPCDDCGQSALPVQDFDDGGANWGENQVVHQLLGNVLEWTRDWYVGKMDFPQLEGWNDGLDPFIFTSDSKGLKSLRSSAWYDNIGSDSIHKINRSSPRNKNAGIGFRCVGEEANQN